MDQAAMFATLVLDRDPLRLEDLPYGLAHWVQSVGGFATAGLILFLLLGLPRWRAQDRASIPGWLRVTFVGATIVAALGYAGYFVTALAGIYGTTVPIQNLMLTIGGVGALIAVGLPFVLNLFQMRFRRIYALAKLSFKEAIRRRVLYAFTGVLLVFLFASWFIPSMPKDEVRTYVGVVFFTMNALLLFTAALMSSFSIPADIRQQTIHTIVTKPVEKFEIVLGRFLGFLALMTVVLVVMTGISLLYVLRGIHPEAAAESLKARIPQYGDLKFEGTNNEREAINVGREWEYRSYIAKPMPGQEAQVARWDFLELPAELGKRNQVRCEYSFDIYRTTKGDEGREVYCTFRFYTWRYKKGNEELFRSEREKASRAGLTNEAEAALNDKLTEQYGYYEINGQGVTDYRTQHFELPGGLFRNALAQDSEREAELKAQGEAKVPLRVRVWCDSPTQYVGMAKYDFYMRLDDSGGSDRARFALNFFKGAFGLWLQLALIVGLAVVLSTYLNGVISLLVTAVLYFGGLAREFVESVALGRNVGGGPLEAMVRITRRELSGASFADSTAIGDQLVSKSDEAFRWLIRRIIDLIPDVDRFDLTAYVAEGFNISGVQMGLDLLLLIAYLLPWFVLAFYLIRWREIASSS